MCVAELNVSVLPCRHRWYHLSRPCTPTSNLSNCGKKLGINGWEIKCDFCPYCSGWNLSNAEYRLVGNDRAPAIGGISRTPSLSLSTTRRETRRGSLSRTDSNNSISIMAGEKNRALNARVDAYLRVAPEPALPSPYPAPLREVDEEADVGLTSSPSDTSSEGQESVRHPSTSSQGDSVSLLKRMRYKSKRLSMSLFK